MKALEAIQLKNILADQAAPGSRLIRDKREKSRVGRLLLKLEHMGRILNKHWGKYNYLRDDVRKCICCSGEFFPGPSSYDRQKFCSRTCASRMRPTDGQKRRVSHKCKRCHQGFETIPSRSPVYCGETCMREDMKRIVK